MFQPGGNLKSNGAGWLKFTGWVYTGFTKAERNTKPLQIWTFNGRPAIAQVCESGLADEPQKSVERSAEWNV
jgi:hypothetical protein